MIKGPQIVAQVLLLGSALLLSACTVKTPGSHKELHCTIIVQSEKAMILESGEIILDPRDIKDIDCYEVWEKPEE